MSILVYVFVTYHYLCCYYTNTTTATILTPLLPLLHYTTPQVVELKLRHLDQVQQAFDLVRSSASAQGAQYVADYCSETSDYRGAIEFLLIANKSEEAFKLAQSQSIVDVYAGFLGTGISAEDAIRVAQYYEKSQNFGQAGRYVGYYICMV